MSEFSRGRRDGNKGKSNPPRSLLRKVVDTVIYPPGDPEKKRRNNMDKAYAKGNQIGQRDAADRKRRPKG